MQLLCSLHRPKRGQPPLVFLLYGKTGCGKTRLVNDKYPIGDLCYRKPPDTKWFDKYDVENVLLLDDFSGRSSGMSLSYVLQLLDRYEIGVEVKGGSTSLLAKRVYVTTNNHPHTWYNWDGREENYYALARRFHCVVGFEGNRPVSLNHKLFFGTITTSLSPTKYKSHECDWEERPGLFPLPTI